MPKIVDHDERRRMIAAAVTDIAATEGLGDVSFRTVADRAGVSVSLVQHYFGDKANLLKTTLQIQSEAMNAHLAAKLADLGDTPGPIALLRAVASAFLPVDDISRRSMLVYQGFAAAALTDDTLRHSEMFANGRQLIEFFADQLTQAAWRRGAHHARRDRTALARPRPVHVGPPHPDHSIGGDRRARSTHRPAHRLKPNRSTPPTRNAPTPASSAPAALERTDTSRSTRPSAIAPAPASPGCKATSSPAASPETFHTLNSPTTRYRHV